MKSERMLYDAYCQNNVQNRGGMNGRLTVRFADVIIGGHSKTIAAIAASGQGAVSLQEPPCSCFAGPQPHRLLSSGPAPEAASLNRLLLELPQHTLLCRALS